MFLASITVAKRNEIKPPKTKFFYLRIILIAKPAAFLVCFKVLA